MTDFYSQRLEQAKEARKAKQARLFNSLPLQKPNTKNPVGTEASDVTALAGKPTDPNAGPELPEGQFSNMFKQYSKDENFKSGMAEYAAAMQALKTELTGVNLPPAILEKKVADVLSKFKDRAVSYNSMQQQQQQQMPQDPRMAQMNRPQQMNPMGQPQQMRQAPQGFANNGQPPVGGGNGY